jgi:hypothetical protein
VKDFDTAGNVTIQHSYITLYINILVLLVMEGHTHRQIDYISVCEGEHSCVIIVCLVNVKVKENMSVSKQVLY